MAYETQHAQGTVTEPAPPDTPCDCCTEERATRAVTREQGADHSEYPINVCERCFNEAQGAKRRNQRAKETSGA